MVTTATNRRSCSTDGQTEVSLTSLADWFLDRSWGIASGVVIADGCKTGIGKWQGRAIRDCLQDDITYIGTEHRIGWYRATSSAPPSTAPWSGTAASARAPPNKAGTPPTEPSAPTKPSPTPAAPTSRSSNSVPPSPPLPNRLAGPRPLRLSSHEPPATNPQPGYHATNLLSVLIGWMPSSPTRGW